MEIYSTVSSLVPQLEQYLPGACTSISGFLLTFAYVPASLSIVTALQLSQVFFSWLSWEEDKQEAFHRNSCIGRATVLYHTQGVKWGQKQRNDALLCVVQSIQFQ
jgi:hypothetical protein